MTTNRINIPYDFARDLVRITWRDILFGLERQYITPRFAIEHAMCQLSISEDCPPALVELASLRKDESIHPSVDELAKMEGDGVEDIDLEKWQLLTLKWVYLHRDSFTDPFETVEILHADFDYPEEMSGIVRYMPEKDPEKLGEKYILSDWCNYIDALEQKIGTDGLN